MPGGLLKIKSRTVPSQKHISFKKLPKLEGFEALQKLIDPDVLEDVHYSPDSCYIELDPHTPLEHLRYQFTAHRQSFPPAYVGKVTKIGPDSYEYYPHPSWIVRKQRITD